MTQIFYEDCPPFVIDQEKNVLKSIELIDKEGFTLGIVSFVFCSDDYLLKLNKEHLNHDYYTDVITFSYNEDQIISGDLFISVDRVKENANTHNISFLNELSRVAIHGLLHLCGYNDKSKEEVLIMRSKEKQYLKMIGFT